MLAIQYDTFGAPDVLRWAEAPDPAPGPGEALVRVDAAGLNFADIYRRQGRFTPAGPAPWIPGYEGAGVIVALGEGAAAAGLGAGDRIGWADSPRSNAELAVVALDKAIPLPDEVDAVLAAAVLLQGLTAHYLVHDSHPLAAGEWAVVHAAAGGVGLLLVQLARLKGARVIALASSEAKRAAALAAGAEVALGYDGWVGAVLRLSGGAHVVYDSVGVTLNDSLTALRARGRVVFYGMAGGPPPDIAPLALMTGSLSITGGDLWTMLSSATERRRRAAELFGLIAQGRLQVRVAEVCALARAADAHTLLEGRGVIGKVVLRR